MSKLRDAAQQALEALETVLSDAYHRRFPECCGRPGSECCGNPNEAWAPEDNKIMDALSPAQRQLSGALRAQPAIPQSWTPTAENINALPESLRLYIADLETNADPAGTVRDLTIARDTIRALEASNRMLRDAAPEAPKPAKPAEQEPVAWMCSNTELMHKGYQMFSATGGGDWNIPVYTAPQPRRRLTDEEIDNTTRKQVDDLLDHIYEYGTAAEGIDYRVRAIARAIERAHGIGEHE